MVALRFYVKIGEEGRIEFPELEKLNKGKKSRNNNTSAGGRRRH